MAEAKVWAYCNKDGTVIEKSGATHVGPTGNTGEFLIKFEKKFQGKYAAVASCTEGFAKIAQNADDHVLVRCTDHKGSLLILRCA